MQTAHDYLSAARTKLKRLEAHLTMVAHGDLIAPGMTDPKKIAECLLDHVARLDHDLAGVAAGHAVLAGNVHREAEAFGRELGFTAESHERCGVAVAVMPFGMGEAEAPAPAPANGKASRIPGRFESAVRGERAG